MELSRGTLGLVAVVILVAGGLLYHAALPKPIPGIPYNERSAKRLLGDVPDFLMHYARTREMMSFLAVKCQEMNTPVIQLFMRPLGRPWVILCDGRESADIMTRRGREFDRADIFREFFHAVIPLQQSNLPTNDQWRFNRKLVGDAMSTSFLNSVGAYRVHENTIDLIDLWREKIRLSHNHAFDVYRDVQYATIDTIWAVAFGKSSKISRTQATHLSKMSSIPLPAEQDATVKIPETALGEVWDMLSTIVSSFTIPMNSPLGRHHHWLAIKLYPPYRRAIATRNRIVTKHIAQAWENFGRGGAASSRNDSNHTGDKKTRCAVELIVDREAALAEKEGRAPDQKSPVLFDEMAGFLQAGFETTSSTLNWGVKYLTKHQDVQTKLRASLRAGYKEAFENGEQPTAEAISMARVPYLEAFIDEVMRHSGILSSNSRVATQDATVLGYRIPKGTDVYMLTNGPSFNSPAFKIDDKKRSATSQQYKGDYERWHENHDLHLFRPERFLRSAAEPDGGESFDARAAPMQSFGAGVRACYGKRLAYLEQRVIYTLMVWNFEFAPLPESVDDWLAHDVLTHTPNTVPVILKEAKS